MILTRQTCGQRSSMAAGSNHQALAIYFSVGICYMFLIMISKCKLGAKSDQGLCMTSGLAKKMKLRSCNFRFKKRVWPQNSSENLRCTLETIWTFERGSTNFKIKSSKRFATERLGPLTPPVYPSGFSNLGCQGRYVCRLSMELYRPQIADDYSRYQITPSQLFPSFPLWQLHWRELSHWAVVVCE